MTHVVHPYAHRIGILRDWKSRWFTTDRARYRKFLASDTKIKEFLRPRLKGMYVSGVEVERSDRAMRVIIRSSRPGLIIGRSGEGATKLKKDIAKLLLKLEGDETPDLKVDIEEVRSPESSASIVAQMVGEGLEKRLPFRRILKQTAEKVMANRDVQGVRITVSGRLGGADMGRKEEIKKGRVPLQTFRADVDFSRQRAVLPYGTIGVKVWIYRGDIFEGEK